MDVWIDPKHFKKWCQNRERMSGLDYKEKSGRITKHQKGRAITREELELLRKNGIIKGS